ncbi:hypothetical protein LXL04_021575 [Taraxacum kok-saghyz]
MDTAQWSEGFGVVKSMEEKKTTRPQQQQKPHAVNCPRCNSSHTKFCYYNNYSLSQPRYFCKTCRRYWTEGGSLRNVPVGGGSRRNKRSTSSSSSVSSVPATVSVSIPASISKSHLHHQMIMGPQAQNMITQNPSKSNNTLNMIQLGQGQSQGQGQDLNLNYTNISLQFGNLPFNPNTTTASNPTQFSAMEFLKSGFSHDSREVMMNMNSLPNAMIMNNNSPAGFNFSLDGFENGGEGNRQGTMSTVTTTAGTSANARMLFPFEDLKRITTSNSDQLLEVTRGQGESSSGYWGTGSGGLGGGSW